MGGGGVMWRRKASVEELRFAYDVGRAHQLLEERLGIDDVETSFERLLRDVYGRSV
jgi:hypothetical protein